VAKLRAWGPVVAWMALIFFLSAQAQLPTPRQHWLDVVLEKSAHTLEYAVLAALLLRALGARGQELRRAFGVAVLLAWLYALTDEFHQRFVPGRSADWSDIVFDWLGAVAGAGLWLHVWTARHRRAWSEDQA
jgi:VanZ family protein